MKEETIRKKATVKSSAQVYKGRIFDFVTENIILETRNLRREFGALVAVADVSIQVQARSFHSIIGPNGAGKTTLFNLLSGNLDPTSGQVFFKGKEITSLPVHRTAHLGIGRSFQITNIFPNLTVLENIRLACQALGKDNFNFFLPHRHFNAYTDRSWAVSGRSRSPAATAPRPRPWPPSSAFR